MKNLLLFITLLCVINASSQTYSTYNANSHNSYNYNSGYTAPVRPAYTAPNYYKSSYTPSYTPKTTNTYTPSSSPSYTPSNNSTTTPAEPEKAENPYYYVPRVQPAAAVEKTRPVNGTASYTWLDGTSYTGEWKDSKREGKGKYNYFGEVYIGNWNDDRKSGMGEITHTNGDKYVGEWKYDMKIGIGLYTWKDGRMFNGTFFNDRMRGYGTFITSAGWQSGIWGDDGLRNGEGVDSMSNGTYYKGNFDNNKKDGHGIYFFADKSKYEGEWKAGQRKGWGILKGVDGRTCAGVWNGDIIERDAKINWPDGRNYIGGSKDGQMDGFGELTWPDGKKEVGEWRGDKLLDEAGSNDNYLVKYKGLDEAIEGNNPGAVNYFLKKGPILTEFLYPHSGRSYPLMIAFFHHVSLSIYKLLFPYFKLDYQSDPTEKTALGQLFSTHDYTDSVLNYHLSVEELLLQNGANPNSIDDTHSLLCYAIDNENIQGIKLLLAYGANRQLKDPKQSTPFSMVKEKQQYWKKELKKYPDQAKIKAAIYDEILKVLEGK